MKRLPRNNNLKYPVIISLTLFHLSISAADETVVAEPDTVEEYDIISVTASRVERRTQDVAGSIDVIDAERIESEKMFNIKDAIQGSPGVLINSKNSAYDSRLIIRGAGQKANYGVREIMVIRDGVPMTDPDSFSRFDFIDTQDIERIEITKGPGSLFGAGSSGGTIQIISKSVFDTDSNHIKLGVGDFGQGNLHGRLAGDIDDSNAYSLTASYRKSDNDWREWNEFESKQLAFKHGYLLDNGATLESELSYHEADLQIPGSMDEYEFESYLESGEQKDTTSSPWQHSGRYSTIWFFNSRYEQEMGDLTLKPRIYANRWDHYHPVTGAINDNPGTLVLGTDLEMAYKHQLWGPSTLVAGVTARRDDTEGAKKFTYADVETSPPPPWNPMGPETILHTNSDEAGELLEEEDATNTLYGFFIQETLHPNRRTTLDIGFRYDRNHFDIDNTAYGEYSWGAGSYTFFDTPESTNTDKTFNLFSPKLGLTYDLSNLLNLYTVIAQSGQVPSESEIQSNPKLDAATARNVEIGLKGRAQAWSFDLALYRTTVSDEIVSVLNEDLTTEFQNAGETLKKGLELSGRYDLNRHFWLEGSFAYSDYSFTDFEELVRTGRNQTPVDRSGNQLPFIPRQQYGLGMGYSHPAGFKAILRSNSWGSYYVDNANTEKYGGYDFVTNLLLSYQTGPHTLSLNVENLFDKLYALEVKKSTSGDKTFSAASPRSAMLSYTYNF
ncbi:MAG: TonB-dependent receptor [Candidatus Thiodiazotropha sp. (ex Clathrolucina costata)]|nr:TonB-dependent receptor [Candidatus Thiodiazotropha taylori]MCG7861243.1 TonB-dependent receptor [Candidatus Thiodiazotropha endolucinida]